MATTLKNKMAGLSAPRRARIDAETDRLHDEYKTLQELRRAREAAQQKTVSAQNICQTRVPEETP